MACQSLTPCNNPSMRTVPFILALIMLGGCVSHSERIASSTNEIRQLASSSHDRFAAIGNESVKDSPDMPTIVNQSEQGMTEQKRILTLTDRIYISLTGVEDETPAWFGVVVWICVALSVIGAAFLVWHLGLGRFISRWLALITPAERGKAQMAACLLDSDDERVKSRVMQMRRDDPVFDRAFRQVAPLGRRGKKEKKK